MPFYPLKRFISITQLKHSITNYLLSIFFSHFAQFQVTVNYSPISHRKTQIHAFRQNSWENPDIRRSELIRPAGWIISKSSTEISAPSDIGYPWAAPLPMSLMSARKLALYCCVEIGSALLCLAEWSFYPVPMSICAWDSPGYARTKSTRALYAPEHRSIHIHVHARTCSIHFV